MTTLNAKCRANFNEWLEDIAENDLELFVFCNGITKAEFGSNDFKLVYAGISTGEPVDCHMIEARVNGKTKDKQLKKLFQTSASVARDPTRLAFALVPISMLGYCTGQHVRQALQESPVKGESIVNKVHIQWGPAVKVENGKPWLPAGVVHLLFQKIPFHGYKVDGTVAAKKGKEKK